MNVAFVSEWLNSPVFVGIAMFLLIATTVIFTYVFIVGSSNDKEVRAAKAECKAVRQECNERYEELKSKYRNLGAKSFEQRIRIQDLEKKNRDLQYRIDQLTKGAEYVRFSKSK